MMTIEEMLNEFASICEGIGRTGQLAEYDVIDKRIDDAAEKKQQIIQYVTKLKEENARLNQMTGDLCDKCGYAMKFPDEPCRCELESENQTWKEIYDYCNRKITETIMKGGNDEHQSNAG